MLVVMTLFVISMLKTSIVELKIGGSSQVAALNFSNAGIAMTILSAVIMAASRRAFALPALGAGCDTNTLALAPQRTSTGSPAGSAVRGCDSDQLRRR